MPQCRIIQSRSVNNHWIGWRWCCRQRRRRHRKLFNIWRWKTLVIINFSVHLDAEAKYYQLLLTSARDKTVNYSGADKLITKTNHFTRNSKQIAVMSNGETEGKSFSSTTAINKTDSTSCSAGDDTDTGWHTQTHTLLFETAAPLLLACRKFNGTKWTLIQNTILKQPYHSYKYFRSKYRMDDLFAAKNGANAGDEIVRLSRKMGLYVRFRAPDQHLVTLLRIFN